MFVITSYSKNILKVRSLFFIEAERTFIINQYTQNADLKGLIRNLYPDVHIPDDADPYQCVKFVSYIHYIYYYFYNVNFSLYF